MNFTNMKLISYDKMLHIIVIQDISLRIMLLLLPHERVEFSATIVTTRDDICLYHVVHGSKRNRFRSLFVLSHKIVDHCTKGDLIFL